MPASERPVRRTPGRCAVLNTLIVLPLCLLAGVSRADNIKKTPGTPKPSAKSARTAPATLLHSSDVMATVEGKPITRRELVYFWLQTDRNVESLLGSLLADRWKAAKGALPSYTVPESEIYDRLFSNQNILYANILSSLITNRLVDIEAKRQGILVTQTQAADYAHQLFNQVRNQQNLQMTDEQLIKKFKLPRDIFMDDMRFRVQSERLLSADIARRNGHPLRADDWIVVRELCAVARPADNGDAEAQFAAAKSRVELWAEEVRQGKPMEEVAREHNEDRTNGSDGLRGPTLRGIGTKSLEDAVWALKPGELSEPLRGRAGWYVFRMEKRGDQISAEERNRMWKQVIAERMPSFLAELRQNAKITSVVPLPLNPPATTLFTALGDYDPNNAMMPPPPPQR